MIVDHRLFSAGPLYDMHPSHGWTQIVEKYAWSGDNSVELAKGWIKSAEGLPALAAAIGLKPPALVETVGRWNRFCDEGHDAAFGRKLMMQPVGSGPFYAIELGRLRCLIPRAGRDATRRGRSCGRTARRFPELYSAGELGSIYSYLYQGTGNIGECLAFGRVSGRNAAAETPWT